LATPGVLLITYLPRGFLITMVAAIALASVGFAFQDHLERS